MRKVKWGIISTAKIGLQKVIPAMMNSRHCEVVAIASQDYEKAKAAAEQLGIPKAYGSYEELLNDKEIEAVYIPLPNHMHVSWSVKALHAGKHVLCEKPIALNADEAQTLLEESAKFPRLKIMEAFMYRHHPQWIKAKQLVDDGAIGELKTIESHFSYYNADPDNIRNKSDIGGGGLMDIGCYNISLSRLLFGAEPANVFGTIERDPVMKTDRLTSGILEFGSGTATFTCSTQLAPYQRVNIFGGSGRIEIEIPFNAPPDKLTRLWLSAGGKTEEIIFDVCDQYTIQGDMFSLAVINNGDVFTPLVDAVNNMKVIDAVVESSINGGWITL